MFAGKTTRLHSIAESMEQHKTLMVKPSVDTRYSASSSITHTGQERSCVVIESLTNIPLEQLHSVDCLLIDEGQFFNNLTSDIQKYRDIVPFIVVSGLDMDYKQIPFEEMEKLAQIATVVENLQATCDYCGLMNATLTKRLTNSPSRILVGDASVYSPRCIACFNK